MDTRDEHWQYFHKRRGLAFHLIDDLITRKSDMQPTMIMDSPLVRDTDTSDISSMKYVYPKNSGYPEDGILITFFSTVYNHF